MVQSNESPFETNYRLQITFNFHVHHQIVLQVAENVSQNESFVMSKVTPASKVPPFDGTGELKNTTCMVWLCQWIVGRPIPVYRSDTMLRQNILHQIIHMDWAAGLRFNHVTMPFYMFVVVNFDALAQASDIRIERRQVVFLCWMQDSNPRSQTPIRQQTECLLTNRLSYRGSS